MQPKIHEFDPVIYPIKIWITVTSNLYQIVNKFIEYPSLDPLNLVFDDKMERFAQMVSDKDSRFIGVLLVFSSKKIMTAGKIAHEATHAARKVWHHLGEDFTGVEADAYFVEWITDCADRVKKGKV